MADELTLVIFDCDLEPPPEEDTRRIIGLSLMEAVSRLCPDEAPEVLHRVVHEFKETFRHYAHETAPLFDGTQNVVRELARREDMLLGIATGKSQRGVQRLLEHYELSACFANIQTADDAPSKPHPAMIDQAMKSLGAVPHRTIMIGDTTYDMEMAGNAGAHGVGVSWGYHPSEELTEAGAAHIVNHFRDLEAIIDRLW